MWNLLPQIRRVFDDILSQTHSVTFLSLITSRAWVHYSRNGYTETDQLKYGIFQFQILFDQLFCIYMYTDLLLLAAPAEINAQLAYSYTASGTRSTLKLPTFSAILGKNVASATLSMRTTNQSQSRAPNRRTILTHSCHCQWRLGRTRSTPNANVYSLKTRPPPPRSRERFRTYSSVTNLR